LFTENIFVVVGDDEHLYKYTNIGDGSLRLVEGTSALRGRLEIFHQGIWGTVCDDYWDKNDTMVACRQLGFV